MSLVVLGDLMVDVVAQVSAPLAHGSDTAARISLAGGGSAANMAAWAGSLGVPAAFVGRVGDDEHGRAAVAALRAAGVDVWVAVDRERPTGTCVVLVEPGGERTMLPDPGANDGPADVPEHLLVAGGHLHVVGYALLRPGARPGALKAIARAQAAGMTVSIDPSSWALLRPGAFPPVDLLVPNEREAAVLAGRPDPAPRRAGSAGDDPARSAATPAGDDPARSAAPPAGDDPDVTARALAGSAAREVVVTLGAAGALWTDGSEVVRVPAAPADVVDTTGAGDAFAAGLLAARLAGAAPRAALEAGCRAAARAVAQPGARPS